MNRKKMVKKLVMVAAGLAVMAGFSAVVMVLWNALVPDVVGWRAIRFWQAVGLLILARLLFGGFGWHRGMHGWGMHGDDAARKRWMKMTVEQRKAFLRRRKELRNHECCPDAVAEPEQENE
jgi:hypothetical protein